MAKQKVFCIGLSRSGTTSLDHILAELGLKSAHFCNFLFSDPPDWKECEEYDALGDSPVPLLYKDLDARFPGSRFILTIRDKGSWLRSMKWMFTHGRVIWDYGDALDSYHRRLYGTRSYSRRILGRCWDSYHADVFEYFSARPGDLLVIRLEEGFDVGEICRFLDLPYREIEDTWKNPGRDTGLGSRLEYNIRMARRRVARGARRILDRLRRDR